MTGDAPFPLPPTIEWQKKFVDAVLDTPGANVPRSALEAIAPFVDRPKDLITSARPDKPAQLRSETVEVVHTSAGEMLVMTIPLLGYAGITWERNERQSTAWRSPSNPVGGDQPSLPTLRTWTGVTADGKELAFAALRTEVQSRLALIELVERANNELQSRDGDRPYDLKEDIALNGQNEPCLLVAQQAVIASSADGGETGGAEGYWGWVAVRGNNRTKARQELYGLSSAEVLTGIPMVKLGLDGDEVAVNPSFWARKLSDHLNREYKAAMETGNTSAPAYRAHKVALVKAQLVIGSPTPRRLYQIVQTSNRRDHVHPPLHFKPNDRARALGRTIIGAYVSADILDPVTADVLTGDLPCIELSGMPMDAKISEQRDFRSMRLLAEFFPDPTDTARCKAIRAALAEPAPSQLSREHVNQRLRAWSALTSVSFPIPWNPRVADVLPPIAAKEGVRLSGRRLPELLEAAETDIYAFEELLLYRAPNWLAAFDIVEADRGSMGAQKVHSAASEDEDGEEVALRIRRSSANALKAMRTDPVRAIGLLREIASTMDEGRDQPRTVDPQGQAAEDYEEQASRDWFNQVFPKQAAVRGRITLPTRPTTEAPPPETDTAAVQRLIQALTQTIDGLQEGVKLVPEFADQIRVHATSAGISRPLPESAANDLVVQITNITFDLRELPSVVIKLSRS